MTAWLWLWRFKCRVSIIHCVVINIVQFSYLPSKTGVSSRCGRVIHTKQILWQSRNTLLSAKIGTVFTQKSPTKSKVGQTVGAYSKKLISQAVEKISSGQNPDIQTDEPTDRWTQRFKYRVERWGRLKWKIKGGGCFRVQLHVLPLCSAWTLAVWSLAKQTNTKRHPIP